MSEKPAATGTPKKARKRQTPDLVSKVRLT